MRQNETTEDISVVLQEGSKKARSGDIPHFTGISSPYEAPLKAEIHVKTDKISIDESTENIINYLKEKGYLGC